VYRRKNGGIIVESKIAKTMDAYNSWLMRSLSNAKTAITKAISPSAAYSSNKQG